MRSHIRLELPTVLDGGGCQERRVIEGGPGARLCWHTSLGILFDFSQLFADAFLVDTGHRYWFFLGGHLLYKSVLLQDLLTQHMFLNPDLSDFPWPYFKYWYGCPRDSRSLRWHTLYVPWAVPPPRLFIGDLNGGDRWLWCHLKVCLRGCRHVILTHGLIECLRHVLVRVNRGRPK